MNGQSLEDKNDSFLTESDEPAFHNNGNKGKLLEHTRSGGLILPTDSPTRTKGPSMTSKSSLFQSDFEDDMVFAKYNFFWCSKKENNKIFSILAELPHQCTVIDAIQRILPCFNQDLESKSSYLLTSTPDQFELFFAKKSGQPKQDYPALDNFQNLNQTGIQNFCLAEKNPSAVVKADGRNSIKAKAPEDANQTLPKVSQKSSMMIQPEMPSAKSSGQTSQIADSQVEEVQETWCFCIPKGKPKRVQLDMSRNRSENNETALTDPLFHKKV